LGLAIFLLLNSLVFALIGIVAGFLIVPGLLIKNLQRSRKRRFAAQLVDGLMILSSSLKGGLSLLQAMEVISEEMPSPISQEFAMIIKENKMGISLEDSLRNMYNRINIDDLKLIINSILVSRETGGDLTKVLMRLSTTLRDNQKLIDSVKTLTTQGRLQGMIMMALPIIFVIFVYSTNPNHFDIMFQDELGRMLLVVAVVLQVVGMFLIRKFSTIKI
jgi:tight adherence protein B